MNWKKLSVYSILFILVLIPLLSVFALAADAVTGGWEKIGGGTFGTVLKYIFGNPVDWKALGTDEISAMIITIAVWILIMITFGDIIATFSSFSSWVAWVGAVLIAIIAANLNWITAFIAWTTGIFAALGAVAVYVGLGAAFVAFLAVNLGVWRVRKWVLRRRALMAAGTAELGGKRLKGTIRGLAEAGEALEEVGGKVSKKRR